MTNNPTHYDAIQPAMLDVLLEEFVNYYYNCNADFLCMFEYTRGVVTKLIL